MVSRNLLLFSHHQSGDRRFILEKRVRFLRGEGLAEDGLAAKQGGREDLESWPLRARVPDAGNGEPWGGRRPLMEKHHSCLNTRAIIEYFQENLPEELSGLFNGLGILPIFLLMVVIAALPGGKRRRRS